MGENICTRVSGGGSPYHEVGMLGRATQLVHFDQPKFV